MKYSRLAHKYAAALYSLSLENKCNKEYLQGLQEVVRVLNENEPAKEWLASSLVRAEEKEALVNKILSGANEGFKNFFLLLAKNGRLVLLNEITEAFQAIEDEANGVTRGFVRSAGALSNERKKEVSQMIEKLLNKKVILQQQEDPNLIGGIVAQVGSYTFDDSLSAHLKKIKEDLTRRIN